MFKWVCPWPNRSVKLLGTPSNVGVFLPFYASSLEHKQEPDMLLHWIYAPPLRIAVRQGVHHVTIKL